MVGLKDVHRVTSPVDVDGHPQKKLKYYFTSPSDSLTKTLSEFMAPEAAVVPTIIGEMDGRKRAEHSLPARDDQDMSRAILADEDDHASGATLMGEDENVREAIQEGEVDDIPPNQQHDAAQELDTVVTATALARTASFVPLASILGRNRVNNKFAPTDATAQQNYLKEVGQQRLHSMRTPLQTPSSGVSLQIRHVIYEDSFSV
jgi:hypothetical protein